MHLKAEVNFYQISLKIATWTCLEKNWPQIDVDLVLSSSLSSFRAFVQQSVFLQVILLLFQEPVIFRNDGKVPGSSPESGRLF